MLNLPTRPSLVVTRQTLIVGGIGAGNANRIGAPIAVLTGLGMLLARAALNGLRTGISDQCFRHSTGILPGVLAPWLTLLGLMTVGTRIGARVDGVGKSALLKFSVAGLTRTVITTAMAVAAALPMAYTLGPDLTHVLIVFALGGLETMMAMGVVLGASSGFVAAFHFARLLILTIVIPAFVERIRRF